MEIGLAPLSIPEPRGNRLKDTVAESHSKVLGIGTTSVPRIAQLSLGLSGSWLDVGRSEVFMPEERSWMVVGAGGSVTVYVYVQSEAGNYAVRAKKVGDILETGQRTPIGANLSDAEIEALFAHE